jgi:chorismate mutase
MAYVEPYRVLLALDALFLPNAAPMPDQPPRSKDDVLARAARFADGELPDVPDEPTPDDLTPWRDRIDSIDRALLYLLNERTAYADVIGYIKSVMGARAYVPTREAEVLANVVDHNTGPFPDNAIRRIFERIIDETRSLEQRKYEGDET